MNYRSGYFWESIFWTILPVIGLFFGSSLLIYDRKHGNVLGKVMLKKKIEPSTDDEECSIINIADNKRLEVVEEADEDLIDAGVPTNDRNNGIMYKNINNINPTILGS